jgi:cbb3-type cytochrome oxidase subunit 3
MPRNRALDRALGPRSRTSTLSTLAIVLMGAVVVVWVFSPGERERREVVSRIELGDEAQRVESLLGPPARCPIGSLEHLKGAFPGDQPPAAVEAAMAGLSARTAFRWVYPLDRDDQVECAGAPDQTEIGFDAEQRVLWYVPLTGRSTLVMPGGFSSDPVRQ